MLKRVRSCTLTNAQRVIGHTDAWCNGCVRNKVPKLERARCKSCLTPMCADRLLQVTALNPLCQTPPNDPVRIPHTVVDETASACDAHKKLDYRKGQRLGWQGETCSWGASRLVNAVMGAYQIRSPRCFSARKAEWRRGFHV